MTATAATSSAPALPTFTLQLFTGFFYDERTEGWELVEEGPRLDLAAPSTLMLAEFLKPGEEHVKGTIMRERAVALGNMTGQHHAERLLVQQTGIPKEWKDFFLVFPGTVWLDSDGELCVPFLLCIGKKWHLRWHWLDHDGGRGVRLVRLS